MRYDNFDDFQRDLDSDRLSDDPFGVEAEIGILDDEDLEHLVVHRTPRAAQPAKPKAPAQRRKAAAKPTPTAKPRKPKKAAA